MSNGGGQSSLGYLFGSNSTENVPQEEPAAPSPAPLKEQDVNATMSEMNVEAQLKKMLLKDLRTELRSHGLSPAGGRDTLLERLQAHFKQTGSSIKTDAFKPANLQEMQRRPSNNYHRPEGQNVGNFLTDRNSSKVLAPPGGKSSFSLG